MSITSRAAGGSRLSAVGLFGLLMASGCRSSTSTSEPAGEVESAPENAPVTLNLGPSTLDSFGADSGASCSDAGSPSTGLDGGASCGATLAASTFQYAICSCGSLQSTGVLTTDGYDSTKGGPTGALGANVGFNASAAWSSAPSLGGNLFSPGGISAPKGGLIRGDLHLGGAVSGGGQTFTVDGNAFVEATLPSSVKVLGTTTHVSSVTSPCNCNSPLPIGTLVSAHAAPNNEDSAIGLSSSAAGAGNPSQIDLPCGDFYLTVISPSKPLTIAAHGHTELYISGAVSASSALTFSIDPGASLDLFVAGGFSATGALSLGTATSPSSCRVYVAGSQFQAPSSASIACNIYAPSASIALPSTVAYGSIVANGVTASGSATLHYDTSVESGTCATCTAASCNDGNPCTVDTCNSNGTCGHTNAANGTICPTGANLCDQSYACQSGVCSGSNPVTCAAQDQCHGVGTCNTSTGTCSNPTLANGTACNDGNACTQSDSCQSGICTGANPITCTAEDQCHSAGTCNPANGTCSNPALANGTACNDGNACTPSDSCQSGSCVGSSPVTCVAADPCHMAGACNPSTGVCSTPTAPNGTTCNDGNACTQSDSCQGGTCTGSNPVTCTASGQCQVAGTCNPATGACSSSNAPNGTACNDNNACTQSDSCVAGTCTGSNPVVCSPVDVCHSARTCNPTTGTCSGPAQSQCPPVDPTVATTIFGSTAFLYSGANPSQTGVSPGTIVAQRAVVLRGRVLDRSSNPVSGVAVTILNHPELGTTLTQSDGTYTMVVNGGGPLTVNLAASGYLPVQRTVPTPWNDYAIVPDVVVTSLDVASTSINLADTSGYQVARATTVTDTSGSRTATLVFPPGTQAVLNTGTSTQPISTLTVRATEYTVGTTGPQAMPGNLPPTTAYTYCAEFTADEELAIGPNASVQFAAPVYAYVDNFLQFNVGEHVPLGAYDRTTAKWVPSPDGRVIGIVSITGGVANIDVDGDGIADSGSALSALGITPGEQAEVATLYPTTPISIWRMPIPHFSQPWDPNWPFGFPPGSMPPNNPPAGTPPTPPDPCGGDASNLLNASRIECQNGILHESLPVAGTPFNLNYASDRVAGYDAENSLLIPLSAATVPSGAIRIDLEVDVAGRSFTASFPPSVNQSPTFNWDGNDLFGRPLQGTQTATVSVGYVYQGIYLTPSEQPGGIVYDSLFGHFSFFGTPATGDRTRQEVTLLQRSTAPIGHWSNEALALGGWNLDVQAVYEPGARILRLGDGTTVTPVFVPGVIQTVSKPPFFTGPVRIGPDGSIYEGALDCVLRVPPGGGSPQKFAGTCSIGGVFEGAGFSGDGGPATAAQFSGIGDIAVAPDGSVYVADFNNHRIRHIDTNGIITTVAGGGSLGPGAPATQVGLGQVFSVDVGPDGTFYFVDLTLGDNVRRVTPDGILSEVADDIPGSGQARLAPDGSLIVSEGNGHAVIRIGPDGVVHPFAGGPNGFNATGDGGPATSAGLVGPHAVAVARDGTVAFTDSQRVRVVTPDGIIRTVAGVNEVQSSGGDNGPGVDAPLFNPGGVAFGPDGTLYIGDGNNNGIRSVGPPMAGFLDPTGFFQFASSDGSRVYTFDGAGRHLTTTDAITGATLYTFGYDAGRLTSVMDVNHDVTTINRDASGNLTGVTNPFGVATTLQLGADGYLASVQDPTGALNQMAYGTGLLSTIEFPNGFTSSKTYDSRGRVATSIDAAGGTLTFMRAADSLTSLGDDEENEHGSHHPVFGDGRGSELELVVEQSARQSHDDAANRYRREPSSHLTRRHSDDDVVHRRPALRDACSHPLADHGQAAIGSDLDHDDDPRGDRRRGKHAARCADRHDRRQWKYLEARLRRGTARHVDHDQPRRAHLEHDDRLCWPSAHDLGSQRRALLVLVRQPRPASADDARPSHLAHRLRRERLREQPDRPALAYRLHPERP